MQKGDTKPLDLFKTHFEGYYLYLFCFIGGINYVWKSI
nr:MAG TPA: hypothetical protein [Bacteriophage sp.]